MSGTVTHLPVLSSFFEVDVAKNELRKSGAFLIRGCQPLPSILDFETLSDRFMVPMVHHSTATVERDPVNEDRTTSTVNLGMDRIPFHREGSYAPGCPDLLMLYCVRPASQGGETNLCDGVILREILPEQIRDFVDGASLKWTWNAPPKRWQETLRTTSKKEALTRLEHQRSKLSSWESLEASFEGDILAWHLWNPVRHPDKVAESKILLQFSLNLSL